MDAKSQLCGLCTHFREVGGGTCLVYGTNVSADGHNVNLRNAITGEDHGCEDFMTPEADDEWCSALERAERCPIPWR